MLIERDMIQGSPEWHAARIANMGATTIQRLVTAKGKKVAASTRQKLLYDFAAEKIEGIKKETPKMKAMERGNEFEPTGRASFQFETGLKVEEVGMIYPDELKRWHVSPDGLIAGQDKGLEIKCPDLATHLGYLEASVLPNEYTVQVQASLAATGYESWYFMSYHQMVKPLILEIPRDEEMIALIEAQIEEFLFDLNALVTKYAA